MSGLEIVAAHDDAPPFAVEAIVCEEDTGLVLSAAPVIRDHHDHPIRVMTSLYDFQPPIPGEVIVKGRRPYRLFAIVHDFDCEPACRAEWVTAALDATFGVCRELAIRALGMHLLGTRFGPFTEEWFRARLEVTLAAQPDAGVERIWLMRPRV